MNLGLNEIINVAQPFFEENSHYAENWLVSGLVLRFLNVSLKQLILFESDIVPDNRH